MTTMQHDKYQAIVEFDSEAEIFHGEVINLRDVITFQGETVSELKQAFAESIQDYLEFCKSRGEAPEKPFSGQFVVRTEPRIHKAVSSAAQREGVSVNKWISAALERAAS